MSRTFTCNNCGEHRYDTEPDCPSCSECDECMEVKPNDEWFMIKGSK